MGCPCNTMATVTIVDVSAKTGMLAWKISSPLAYVLLLWNKRGTDATESTWNGGGRGWGTSSICKLRIGSCWIWRTMGCDLIFHNIIIGILAGNCWTHSHGLSLKRHSSKIHNHNVWCQWKADLVEWWEQLDWCKQLEASRVDAFPPQPGVT